MVVNSIRGYMCHVGSYSTALLIYFFFSLLASRYINSEMFNDEWSGGVLGGVVSDATIYSSVCSEFA